MQTELEILREENLKLKAKLSMQESTISSHLLYIAKLEEEIRVQLLARFGRSSEQFVNPNQLSLFDEIESDAELIKEADTVCVEAHKKSRGKRKPLPSFLPRSEIVYDLTVEERTCRLHNIEMKKIGEDRSEQLDIEPERIKIIAHVRPKYSCPCCDGNIKQHIAPKQPIPGSMAAPSLLSFIAVSKFVDHLPLYRLEQRFSRIGVDLPRSTMARWMIKTAEVLTPLYNLLNDELLSGEYLQMDETTVQVLKEKNREAHKKSYMLVRGRAEAHWPPIVLFDYFPSRAGKVIGNLLGEFRGTLQTDGYQPYSAYAAEKEIKHVACFAHARRKFWQAFKASKSNKGTLAYEGVEWFREIYKIEGETKEMDIRQKLDYRQEKLQPLLTNFRQWLDESLPKVPSTLKTGEAMKFILKKLVNI